MRTSSPVSRVARRASASLVALGLVLVLAGVLLPPGFAEPSGGSHPAAPTVVTAPDGLSSRTVDVTASNGTATQGSSVDLKLHVSPDNCTGFDLPNRTVVKFAVALGDGYVYEASGWPMVPVFEHASCSSAPWNSTYPLDYAYRDPGTYRVVATVSWKDGIVANSSALIVTVVAQTSPLEPLAIWLAGGSIVAASALGACYLLRVRLPPTPSLPPRRV
jgi:hypothetical protein